MNRIVTGARDCDSTGIYKDSFERLLCACGGVCLCKRAFLRSKAVRLDSRKVNDSLEHQPHSALSLHAQMWRHRTGDKSLIKNWSHSPCRDWWNRVCVRFFLPPQLPLRRGRPTCWCRCLGQQLRGPRHSWGPETPPAAAAAGSSGPPWTGVLRLSALWSSGSLGFLTHLWFASWIQQCNDLEEIRQSVS